MISLVKPMARMTDISFTCSYRLPDIDDDSEKKQMNMVIMMTMLKINSRVDSALMKMVKLRVYLHSERYPGHLCMTR